MKKLARDPQIVWRNEKRREEEILAALERGEDVGDRGSVILIVGGTMHQLNLVGGYIWNLCDGSRSLDDVVETLASEFDVHDEVLRHDVEAFVNDLVGRGWLRYA